MTFRSARDLGGRRRPADDARSADNYVDDLALIYAEYSRSLLKLAALLVADASVAREMMYEAFAALGEEALRRKAAGRETNSGDALAFLVRTIVCLARAARERDPAHEADTDGSPSANKPSASKEPANKDMRIISAVRVLPGAQREALILRYYGQLSEEQAAAAMGVRTGTLRANIARGMAALRTILGPQIVARE